MIRLHAEITEKMNKNVIIPLGIRDVDIIKNHRDECDNRDNNDDLSLLKCSLQKNQIMSAEPRKLNVTDNEARMENHPEIFSSKFHVISISVENLKLCTLCLCS